jgi:hypothetical protein
MAHILVDTVWAMLSFAFKPVPAIVLGKFAGSVSREWASAMFVSPRHDRKGNMSMLCFPS